MAGGSVISKTILIALFFCFLLIASFGVETAEAQKGGGGGGGGGKVKYCIKPSSGCCKRCLPMLMCNSWCKKQGAHHGQCKGGTCYCYRKC
ncbi:PREDICTED: toxin Tz2-like [Ipomoea nil]|uniref:toxin Tz2-like n=1 Tax=Ipomoea nil TaxID=35883 RepID=UPI000900AAF3|nr:PREDICTED: toxin Tz2-like [Ipomoea nil]